MGRPAINGTPMDNNERKRNQRARAKKLDIKTVELELSATERATLDRLCQVRGGVRGPYDRNEFIATLIRRDAEHLEQQLADLGCCGKCGDTLPGGCGGVFKGEAECWHTRDHRSLML